MPFWGLPSRAPAQPSLKVKRVRQDLHEWQKGRRRQKATNIRLRGGTSIRPKQPRDSTSKAANAICLKKDTNQLNTEPWGNKPGGLIRGKPASTVFMQQQMRERRLKKEERRLAADPGVLNMGSQKEEKEGLQLI